MTCRHGPNDPACSSNGGGQSFQPAPVVPKTSVSDYTIEETYQGPHALVIRVKYAACDNCAFDSNKVMVYSGLTLSDAVKWREIDPHFYGSSLKRKAKAPSPCARFPGSDRGWRQAILFADTVAGVKATVKR